MLSLIEKGQSFLIDKLHKSLYLYHQVLNYLDESDFTTVEKSILHLLFQSKLFGEFSKIEVREIKKILQKQKVVNEILMKLEEKNIIEKISKLPLIYEITDDYIFNTVFKKDTN